MRSAEIRSTFLQHFERNGHTVVPSASLIADDPTLLLVNAGMVPFKPYFLGEIPAPYPRATSVQKVIRTGDLEEVGKTARHASFFEMNGNFSFGDYFKEGAIPLAWDLLTRSRTDGGFGFEADKLWVTVYLDDDEAADIWHEKVGVPRERIQRMGKADNFWSMGVPGPCGPCSEIYFDRGPDFGIDGGPEANETRYMEVWNLVFMQFARGEQGSGGKDDYPILGDLPKQNIDTGMGLERMAALLQGVDNIYEIDTTGSILQRAAALTGTTYGADPKSDVWLRVIADHTRATTMLIGDGVTPSNEGRGYVLRRMARRVVRSMRLLGAQAPTLGELVGQAIEVMGESYTDLITDRDRILSYAVGEEESFLQTLRTGTTIFDTAVAEAKSSGSSELSGERAFTLHDTYGFPFALTLEMAAEQGLSVDEAGFNELMSQQRGMAKADRKAKGIGHADVSAYRAVLDEGGPTPFTGYEETERVGATVRAVLVGGAPVQSATAGTASQDAEVVLDATPFYGEGGGQVGDTGTLSGAGFAAEVTDTQRALPELIVHKLTVTEGSVSVGDTVTATVDGSRRRAIMRAHTATHLLHAALRRALGPQVTQAGSIVLPDRLRFDFSSPTAVPHDLLGKIEDEVNEVLLDDLEVSNYVTSQADAKSKGAMMLFGEKYGDEVRVLSVGDYSLELCGGTHVSHSGQIGSLKVLSESSIGSGVRRIEALTGLDAFRFLAREHELVAGLAESLKARPEELADRIESLQVKLRDAEKELAGLRGAALLQDAPRLAEHAPEIAGVRVVTHQVPDGTSPDDARALALDVRGRLGNETPVVVAVFVVGDGRAQVVVAANEAAKPIGLGAGRVVKELAPRLGGGGGGKDDIAQGGGTNAAGVPDAITALEALVCGT